MNEVFSNPITWLISSLTLLLIILVLSSNMGKKYSLWEDLDDKEDDARDKSLAGITLCALFCSFLISELIETSGLGLFKNTKDPFMTRWFFSAFLTTAWTMLFYQIGRKHAKKEQKEHMQKANSAENN